MRWNRDGRWAESSDKGRAGVCWRGPCVDTDMEAFLHRYGGSCWLDRPRTGPKGVTKSIMCNTKMLTLCVVHENAYFPKSSPVGMPPL